VRIRVIMPAIIDQAGRNSNVDEADGVNRRHRFSRRSSAKGLGVDLVVLQARGGDRFRLLPVRPGPAL
jgi:hypothetical protein